MHQQSLVTEQGRSLPPANRISIKVEAWWAESSQLGGELNTSVDCAETQAWVGDASQHV